MELVPHDGVDLADSSGYDSYEDDCGPFQWNAEAFSLELDMMEAGHKAAKTPSAPYEEPEWSFSEPAAALNAALCAAFEHRHFFCKQQNELCVQCCLEKRGKEQAAHLLAMIENMHMKK